MRVQAVWFLGLVFILPMCLHLSVLPPTGLRNVAHVLWGSSWCHFLDKRQLLRGVVGTHGKNAWHLCLHSLLIAPFPPASKFFVTTISAIADLARFGVLKGCSLSSFLFVFNCFECRVFEFCCWQCGGQQAAGKKNQKYPLHCLSQKWFAFTRQTRVYAVGYLL